MAATLIAVAFVGYKAATVPHDDFSQLVPVARVDFSNINHQFTPAQLHIAIHAVRINGCLVAEKAVRHAMRPAKVGFDPCLDPDDGLRVTLSDDIKEMTVSGIAHVGREERPFTVVMQHHPWDMSEGSFIVNTITVQPPR